MDIISYVYTYEIESIFLNHAVLPRKTRWYIWYLFFQKANLMLMLKDISKSNKYSFRNRASYI
jgi:hypothetical protein